MSINAVDLLEHVITPTLRALGLHSSKAEQQLLGCAAEASGFNPFIESCKGLLGIYQISSQQHRRAWDQYLAFRPDLASKVRGLASQHHFLKDPDQELKTNLAYATAIARVIVMQEEEQLIVAGTAA